MNKKIKKTYTTTGESFDPPKPKNQTRNPDTDILPDYHGQQITNAKKDKPLASIISSWAIITTCISAIVAIVVIVLNITTFLSELKASTTNTNSQIVNDIQPAIKGINTRLDNIIDNMKLKK